VVRGRTIRGALVTAPLAAAVVAASAAAAGLGPTTRVTVRPGSGTPHTRFALSFRVPLATGTFGSLIRTDTVSVTGPHAANCQAGATRTLRPARKGKRVRLTLRPAKGGGGWCAGRWRGTVVQSEAFRCKPIPTALIVCPQLVVAPRTIARFRFRVKPASQPPAPAGDVPTFAGLTSATTCPSPHPVRPALILPRPSSYTLTWTAATDPVTPTSQIVYDIFVATSPGAENYAKPTYTTSPGATSYVTPGMTPNASVWFVVRARNAAGREDSNTVERQGVVDCPPISQPQLRRVRR
jgi:hypothetical protein